MEKEDIDVEEGNEEGNERGGKGVAKLSALLPHRPATRDDVPSEMEDSGASYAHQPPLCRESGRSRYTVFCLGIS